MRIVVARRAEKVRSSYPWIAARWLPLALLTILFFWIAAPREIEPPAVQAEMPMADSLVDAEAGPSRGSLVIMGGSERFDNRAVWSEIVELAGGEGSRIAVFPTASGAPVQDGEDVVRVLNDLGADAFLVPVAIRGFEISYQEAVRDSQLVESVRQATGVFFVGGEQARLRQALVLPDGQNSPLLEAVWAVYRRGGVVAGTSAGAAVMSRIMFRSAQSILATLESGVNMGKEIDFGFGFMPPEWFVDQHCIVRGRFARALVAMNAQGFSYGVGIDEDTALVVRGESARVVGYRGVIVLDLTDADHDADATGFNVKNVKLSYLDRGDTINLRSLHITPAPEKAGDRKVEPSAPDFRPRFRKRVFSNDILGNSALLDVMIKLLDNRFDEAIGLAFDGEAATRGPTAGYEFRFYRQEDTVGWQTESFGGDDYTVVNIHLDVTRVKMNSPLYTK
ncbi:MAG TPA: cyanophycinase [Pirellulaceae bacterium]|nr:cyanophycinase [Pirellulaceae bacterium]